MHKHAVHSSIQKRITALAIADLSRIVQEGIVLDVRLKHYSTPEVLEERLTIRNTGIHGISKTYADCCGVALP
jgi:hypothetical protein